MTADELVRTVPAADEPEPTTTDPIGQQRGERDERGRFRPGNKAAVNRAAPLGSAERQRLFKESLLAAVSPRELVEAARSMLAAAKAGDVSAWLALTHYLVGKPREQEAEDKAGVAERLAALYASWMRSADEYLVEQVDALQAENEQLRTAQREPIMLPHAPRQQLIPGPVGVVGIRQVHHEERRPARSVEHGEPKALPGPELPAFLTEQQREGALLAQAERRQREEAEKRRLARRREVERRHARELDEDDPLAALDPVQRATIDEAEDLAEGPL